MGSVQRSVLISAVPCKFSPLRVAVSAGSFSLWQCGRICSISPLSLQFLFILIKDWSYLILMDKDSYDQPRQHIEKQRHYFVNKGPSSQGCHFSSSHVWMWELGWALKNWCFWTVELEKTLESTLDCKEIQPVHPKGNQSWIFIVRTDAEAEAPILWPPDAKNWFIGKDPDAVKDWRQEEKGMTEDEMAGWHHRLDGHEFE